MEDEWAQYQIKGNFQRDPNDWTQYAAQSPIGKSIVPQEQFDENPVMSYLRNFNNTFERSTHGAMQPLLESGYLGNRVRQGSENVAREREEGARLADQLNPNASMAGGITGNLAMALPGIVAGGGPASLLRSMLGGAVTSGLGGAAEYVNPGESRLENALVGAGLGGAFGVIPGAAKLTGKAIKKGYDFAKNVKNAYPVEKVAKTVMKDAQNMKNKYQNLYDSFHAGEERHGVKYVMDPGRPINTEKTTASQVKEFMNSPFAKAFKESDPEAAKQFEQRALHEVTKGLKPKMSPKLKKELNYKFLNKEVPDSYMKSFREFLKEPTLRNAQNAQSDLRKFAKSAEGKPNTPSEKIKAIKAAKKARSKIKNSMESALKKSENPNALQEYRDITKGYKDEAVDYIYDPTILKYQNRELTDPGFVKALTNSEKFQKRLGSKYPQMQLRENLPKYAKGAAMGLGGIGGIFGLNKSLDYLLGD